MSTVGKDNGPGDISLLVAAMSAIATLDWRQATSLAAMSPGSSEFGHYEGLPPQLAFLSDGRLVRLLAELSYVDASGWRWVVPRGIEVDGASIPRPLWSLIGGPFEGVYRNASIVHDHFCVVRNRSWRDTHRMFHGAMRASGVASVRAKIMYYFVYRFGPRWTAGLESFAAFATPEELSERDARGLRFDAEAIYNHDLDLAEIEALADWRRADTATSSPVHLEGPGEATDALALARLLTLPGGSGTAEDAALIAARAALLPSIVLDRFSRQGVRFIACRDSVTDFEHGLRGVVPRGWGGFGKTWDDIAGVYLPASHRIVVATRTAGTGRAVAGDGSSNPGAMDMVLRAAFLAFDFGSGHAVLNDPKFRAARDADFAKLGGIAQQAGNVGLQESFATSGTSFLSEPVEMSARWPALHAYWLDGPATDQRTGEPQSAQSSSAVGTIRGLDDGSIMLDLRAESNDGAIGHAQFVVSAADPSHAALKELASTPLAQIDDPYAPRLLYA